MRKIPTIFERDWDGDRSRVTQEPNPVAAWVLAGEGMPYRKLDGTCCMVASNKLFKRREIKAGKPTPADFLLVEKDKQTGKTVGWVPVGDGPEDKWFNEAFSEAGRWADGTYELVGPKVQGNPEGFSAHRLIKHDSLTLKMVQHVVPDFETLRRDLADGEIEGIVWHHDDGRMAKIKARDFGVKR